MDQSAFINHHSAKHLLYAMIAMISTVQYSTENKQPEKKWKYLVTPMDSGFEV